MSAEQQRGTPGEAIAKGAISYAKDRLGSLWRDELPSPSQVKIIISRELILWRSYREAKKGLKEIPVQEDMSSSSKNLFSGTEPEAT